MKLLPTLRFTLSAAVLGVALAANGAGVQAPQAADPRDDRGASGTAVDAAPANRPSEWMMLLAGLAIAGWIAARRSGSLQD